MSFLNDTGTSSSKGLKNPKGLHSNPKHSNNGEKTDRNMKRHGQIHSYSWVF